MSSIQFLGEDVDLLDAIAKLSSQKGYRFSQHSDTRELLAIIHQSPPSLIIIAPSRHNKWNVVKVAAEINTITKHIPLIVINNISSEAQVLAALKLGVSDYFKYPVSLPQLVKKVDSLVSTPSPNPVQEDIVLENNPFDTCTLIGHSPAIEDIKKNWGISRQLIVTS